MKEKKSQEDVNQIVSRYVQFVSPTATAAPLTTVHRSLLYYLAKKVSVPLKLGQKVVQFITGGVIL